MTLHYGKSLLPSTVGFDRLLSTFEEFDKAIKPQTYPPYNLVKTSDTHWLIEIAIAGFNRDEIEITVDNGKLFVIGKVNTKQEQREFIHCGIGKREFNHRFILAETVQVRSANFIDGLLVIELENVIPEERKPRKIEIGSKNTTLLTS